MSPFRRLTLFVISGLSRRVHPSRSAGRRTATGPRVPHPSELGLRWLPLLHLREPSVRVPRPLRPPPERRDRLPHGHVREALPDGVRVAAARRRCKWGTRDNEVTFTFKANRKTRLSFLPSSSLLSARREDKIKAIVDDIMEKLPDPFNMIEIMGKVEERTPYVVVAFQVAQTQDYSNNLISNLGCTWAIVGRRSEIRGGPPPFRPKKWYPPYPLKNSPIK
jgi:hypothetical protein